MSRHPNAPDPDPSHGATRPSRSRAPLASSRSVAVICLIATTLLILSCATRRGTPSFAPDRPADRGPRPPSPAPSFAPPRATVVTGDARPTPDLTNDIPPSVTPNDDFVPAKRTNAFGMTFIEILEPGPDGSPRNVRDITLGNGDPDSPRVTIAGEVPRFYLLETEVTRAQWHTVMGADTDPSLFKDHMDLPVNNVSWHQAVAFCVRLSEMDGKKYRLPTEYEWEVACRVGGKRDRELLGDVRSANTPNAPEGPSKVKYGAGTDVWSGYHLFGMLGNVAELTSTPTLPKNWDPSDTDFSRCDWLTEAQTLAHGPRHPARDRYGAFYAVRGGFWSIPAEYCTPGNRWGQPSTFTEARGHLGFRVVMMP